MSFLSNKDLGIPGTTEVDSGTKGPVIALIALTHGNEPAGLRIFEMLFGNSETKVNLLQGKVLLITSNIEAYNLYASQKDPLQHRFIDHDMNRIWNTSYQEGSSEYARREELKIVLSQADIILDIHSVSKGDDVLGIADNISMKDAQSFIDAEKILVQDTKSSSMTSWFARQGKLAFGIEAGNHISNTGVTNGMRIVKNMLAHFGLIEDEKEFQFPIPENLEFLQEIKPNTPDFHYARDFNNWEPIGKGEIYAYDGENKGLSHELDGDIRIGIVAKKILLGRGAGFLFRKI